jgi:TFIIF-interacting CTD phosphatase-like protein
LGQKYSGVDTRHKNLEIFLNELQKQDGLISDFDPLLWHSLVDYVTVYNKDELHFTFKNGLKIPVK